MKRFAQQLFSRKAKDILVGKDHFGNKFFIDGEDSARRFVKHKHDAIEYV
jgi:hypothetical protein